MPLMPQASAAAKAKRGIAIESSPKKGMRRI
jgi:hypothetical protein